MSRTLKLKKKRNLILESASRVFTRNGYAATRIAEVAVEAGIGKGTIYEYFKSKEDLFFAVFEWFFSQTNEAITVDIFALTGTASQRLTAMNDAIISAWTKEMDSFALVMEFWSASASSTSRQRFKKAFKAAYVEITSVVDSLIREGVKSGEFKSGIDSKALAAALVGTWDALLLQTWFEAIDDPGGHSRAFLKIVLSGLTKKEVL